MPVMGQLRFIISIPPIFFLLLFFICAQVPAQNQSETPVSGRELIRLWDAAKLDSLQLLFHPFADANPDHPVTKFLKAAQETDGKLAAQEYLEVIEKGGDSEVVPRAMTRLTQYNLAIGNFIEAIRWSRRLEMEFPDFQPDAVNSPASDEKSTCYTLQLGVFRSMENARKLSARAKQYNITSQIHRTFDHGHPLFLVCTSKFTSKPEANEAGKHISNEHKLDYEVVKCFDENH
jgi:hypothetical protein